MFNVFLLQGVYLFFSLQKSAKYVFSPEVPKPIVSLILLNGEQTALCCAVVWDRLQ